MILAKDLRSKFLQFFKDRGHSVIESASVVPDNDPTCLFITAGMQPLVPYLLGSDHPAGNRLVDVQKCIRTGDIEEVGDDVHLTFFEMLGNWSLGDYFKQEAVAWSFEFLTSPEFLGLPMDRLAVSVFAGDDDAPFDKEAYLAVVGLGFASGRIAKLGKKDNWWGPAGATGPCGPDTEIFYWVGELPAPEHFDSEDPQWVEIWNNVFMQYNKQADGSFELLAKPNVDTGMGLERITAVLNGKKSVYETEIFAPMFDKLNELLDEKIDCYNRSARVVVEHLRAATIILGDGVVPGNVDQSYVLRRIIRRAINEGRKLGLSGLWVAELVKVAIAQCGDFFTKLITNQETILAEVLIEEEQFIETLEKGIKEFNKMIASIPPHIENKVVGGRKAFNLYETYGFPVELTQELASEVGFNVDMKGYDKAYKKHQELSRKGAEKKFKGGLADDSVQTAHLHTATHLLHQALKNY